VTLTCVADTRTLKTGSAPDTAKSLDEWLPEKHSQLTLP
jgi:hypothetical protein